MVKCLWFVLVNLLSTPFLFTYLRTFHLYCLHYLTDYNKTPKGFIDLLRALEAQNGGHKSIKLNSCLL